MNLVYTAEGALRHEEEQEGLTPLEISPEMEEYTAEIMKVAIAGSEDGSWPLGRSRRGCAVQDCYLEVARFVEECAERGDGGWRRVGESCLKCLEVVGRRGIEVRGR